MSTKTTSAAFTLTELLIGVSIIAVLVALLFPQIGKIKEEGRSAVCLSNLRKLGIAFHAYTTEHDGSVPFVEKYGGYYGSAQVFSLLLPYDGDRRSYQCPSDKRIIPKVPNDSPVITDNKVSYASNDLITGNYVTSSQPGGVSRTTQIQKGQSKVVLFFDTDLIYARFMTIGEALGVSSFDRNYDIPAHHRHRNGANFLFVDGHTEWLETSKFPTTPSLDYPDSSNPSATFSPLAN